MAIRTRPVFGNIRSLTGGRWQKGGIVRITASGHSFVSDAIVLADPVEMVIDAATGDFSGVLWCNDDGTAASTLTAEYPNREVSDPFILYYDDGSAIDLAEILVLGAVVGSANYNFVQARLAQHGRMITEWDGLTEALEALGTTDAVRLIFPAGTVTELTEDTNIPANVEIVGYHGTIATNGFELTFSPFGQQVTCGRWPFFDESGGGAVTFAQACCTFTCCEWWGAVGDGATLDHVPCQRSIDEAIRAKVKCEQLGTYAIAQRIKFPPGRNQSFTHAPFLGDSLPQCGYIWAGAENDYMVEMNEISYSSFGTLVLNNRTNAVQNVGGILLRNSNADNTLGAQNRFDRILIQGAYGKPAMRLGNQSDEGDGFEVDTWPSNIENIVIGEYILYDCQHPLLIDTPAVDANRIVKFQNGGHPSANPRDYLMKVTANGGYMIIEKAVIRCDDIMVDHAILQFEGNPISFGSVMFEAGTDTPCRLMDISKDTARGRWFINDLSCTNYMRDTNGIAAKLGFGVGQAISNWSVMGDIEVTRPLVANGVTWQDQSNGDLVKSARLGLDAVPERFKTTQDAVYQISGTRYAFPITTGIQFSAGHIVSAGKYGVVMVQRNAAGVTSTKVVTETQAYDTADEARNVIVVTGGTAAGYLVNGALAAGVSAAVLDTGTGTILDGATISFAGHATRYRVTSALSGGNISFTPALTAPVANNEAVTLHHITADAGNARIGYVLVKANADTPWTANVDDMTPGSDCVWAQFNNNFRAEFRVSGAGHVVGSGHYGRDKTNSAIDTVYPGLPIDPEAITLNGFVHTESRPSSASAFAHNVTTEVFRIPIAANQRIFVTLDYDVMRTGSSTVGMARGGIAKIVGVLGSGGLNQATVTQDLDTPGITSGTLSVAVTAQVTGGYLVVYVNQQNSLSGNNFMGMFEAKVKSVINATPVATRTIVWAI